MYKGTITDSYGRVSKIEIKDTSDGVLGIVFKAAIAAGTAVVGCLATYGTNKALEYLENKKKKPHQKE